MPVALVTGVSGQTGGYLAEILVAEGWTVHGLVRRVADADGETSLLPAEVEQIPGDLEDPEGIREVIATSRPDAVFNLGGISSVAYSWAHPERTGRITGLGVAALLDATWQLSRDTGKPVSFVQASSAEIFGSASVVPQTEETPLNPVNPYGAAKAYAHHLVGVYRGLGLDASSCILYNHESPRRPATFVTRKITREVARIARGLSTDLALGNLDAVRDWGWAPDYARALLLAATGSPGNYIIASGQPHTVRDFVEAAFSAAGVDDWQRYVRQDPAFMRPLDASALVGDPTKARTVLGWSPTVSFEEMVRAMVENDLAEIPLS